MKTRKVVWTLIFLILVSCVKEKAKESDPIEEALADLRTILPKHSQLTKERINQLEGISFSGTAITDKELKYILIFPNLDSLSLTKTKITDVGLESIKDNKVRHLDIDATLITNRSIKILRDWKYLKVLNISYTNVDDAALEDILKLNVSLIAAGTKLSKSAKEKIRRKMQFEDEEYEIQ
ncbi:hypothetical protein [Leptospira alexanderi]|uniref:hypothetical protein n=1 Tax=Leptospira alexanderi TaxID=100053 RepID=UPI000300EEAE|nr:hypothetical protein [Leptospira alexanderi]